MTPPSLAYLDLSELRKTKQRAIDGDQRVIEAVQKLTSQAEELLSLDPESVVEKPRPGKSGDLHDFYAIGGYSWPSPDMPDGLPYIYRDSETNPEAIQSGDFDKGRYEEMVRRVAVLSLAYFYTDDEAFAIQATKVIRVWFIEPDTRMNPNFQHAAARPGVWDGHFSGVIEGVMLIEMLDYVRLLETSKAWTSSDDSELRRWFGALNDWLVRSRFGRREAYSTNNHGSYFLAQVLAFASYSGQPTRARRAVTHAASQLSRQIARDGSMPRELDRADGWFYSIYGLRAFTLIARLAEQQGADMWHQNRGVLAQACSSLAAYAGAPETWPFTRAHKPWRHDAFQLFHAAARAYGSPEMLKLALSAVPDDDEMLHPTILTGVETTELGSAGRSMPEAIPWSMRNPAKQSPVMRLEALHARAFGVLAARGLWRGRRL